MANSRARNKLELLDNHLATGTEATYTFTPPSPLNMKTRYREIQIFITGKVTAALNMQLLLDASANYDTALLEHDTTTLAGSVGVDQSFATILGVSLLDGAVSFYIKASIVLNDANDLMQIMSTGFAAHEGMHFRANEDQTGKTVITSITIQTDTSTWIAGTEISIYGLQR